MTRAGRQRQFAIDSFVDHPGLTEQLLEVQGLTSVSWTPPSIREALSIPAVFRAVSFISTVVGSLTMEAWRNAVLMDTAPALVSRPGAFSTPRDFYRDTAWCLATRGEYIWWVADRDPDTNAARKFLLLPPQEVQVAWDRRFPLMRTYRWRNKDIPAMDIEHGTYVREPGQLRGSGPLQMCGAALSAGVEANAWAARFFSKGGAPSTHIHSDVSLNETEATALRNKWLEREGNEVRVTSGPIQVEPHQIDPESAQLLQSRQQTAVDVATAFGMDAELLNAIASGASLTYQNVGQRFDNFVRSTLAPGYLEPIEHGISEHLPRTTVGRFSLTSFLRADIRTQADVYSTLRAAGVAEAEAAKIAGLDSLVDTEPVPAPELLPTGRIPSEV
jgi:HK97 family phage portal protein